MAAETVVRLPSDSSTMTVDEVFASMAAKPPRGGVKRVEEEGGDEG